MSRLAMLLELLCLMGLAVVGLLLLPFFGLAWSTGPRDRSARGGYWDHR